MEERELLPDLFRTEYQKMVSVLCYLFGIDHIQVAEDIVSDTFLSATESWAVKGIPDHPAAWLYTVAKNKTKNYLKRNTLFEQKLAAEITYTADKTEEIELDLSVKNITDSQLAMIFTVCNPAISGDSQISLALNLLCGFGIQEIADAFLTNREVVYKRINRAKEKLRAANIKIKQPGLTEIDDRLQPVLTTLYLLFSEGYYSVSQDTTLRRDLCAEAMRLTYLLAANESTNKPAVNALLSLMCFHTSRFEARTNQNGEYVLYQDQDETLWNKELIMRGEYYLNRAATGNEMSRYHLEAGIAYWHTQKQDSPEKWQSILGLYDDLLELEFSPIAALNRTFALAKTSGKEQAILVAQQLGHAENYPGLTENHLYYSLLGNLYTGLDDQQALLHYETSLGLARSAADKAMIAKNIRQLKED